MPEERKPMMNEYICITGARENNLKNVDLEIRKGTITAFAGVSGSGKSSVVFDTIAAESMRQLYETFPLYVRNRMPYYPAAKVESIENLTPAVIIDQRPVTGDVRSTVGTMTEVSSVLRLLYSRFGTAACEAEDPGDDNDSSIELPAGAFSFNDPAGMCPVCSGLGKTVRFDMDKVLDTSRSLNEEAIRMPGFQKDSYQWQMYANSGLFDNDKPLKDYSEEEWQEFLHGKDHIVDIMNNTGKVWDDSYKLTYEGLQDRIERLYLKKAGQNVSKATANILKNFTREETCPACGGRRLNHQALERRILGYDIWEMGEVEITKLIEVLETAANPATMDSAAIPLLERILQTLRRIRDIGLGYLNLNRISSTLSGGEAQRLKVVRNLGSGLTGMTYIFDEPSIGLHPKDISRLNDLLLQLKERGNTVIVVEHDRDVLRIADEIIEMGPGAGSRGGEKIFQGSFEELLGQTDDRHTPTGKWLRAPIDINSEPCQPQGWLQLTDCSLHNLKGFDVRIPQKVLTAVTGLAGSGKSSLACGELICQIPNVTHISQAPVGSTSRSNPASYTGVLDEIRKIFAKESGENASLFSFNAKGACPVCGGRGVIETEMAFMDPITVTCDACEGTRYNRQALSYTIKGKNIAEVLNMTIAEAMEFFENKKIRSRLQMLIDVGLDYLTLGQPTSTLSGGECQRMKLAAHLKESGGIYVMDEPTTGLHGQDIKQLMKLLDRLVDNGNTVIVVEHDPDMIAHADWIIDLGPGGGSAGGEVLFEGTVTDLLNHKSSAPAECLRNEIKM